jgi:NADH-quinone oxidoreductase subunit N
MLYGVTGSTAYDQIAASLGNLTGDVRWAFLFSLVLLMAGLGFKVAAFPFHAWTPDAYEGAPLPITGYLAATSKAAGFALILRFFSEGLAPATSSWQWLLVILSAATMIFGNLVALQQRNIKRLLAYSSIGQVGYMLMAIAALSEASASTLLLHLTGYTITNMAVFTCLVAYYNHTGEEDIPRFAGLAERQPFLALVLTVSMFSLAGLPFFAGFLTKFMMFGAVSEQGFLWLAGLAVAMSLVSLYYYLQVMRQMYVEQPAEPARFRPSPVLLASAAVLLVAVILIGVYPQPVFSAADMAAKAVIP